MQIAKYDHGPQLFLAGAHRPYVQPLGPAHVVGDERPAGSHRHPRANFLILIRFFKKVFAQIPRVVGMKEHSAVWLDYRKLKPTRQDRIEYGYRESHERSAEHILGIPGTFSQRIVPIQVEELPEDGDVVSGVGRVLSTDAFG